MAKYTEAKRASNKRWDEANLDRISVALPKGDKDRIKAAAAAAGRSTNGYIVQLIQRDQEDQASCALHGWIDANKDKPRPMERVLCWCEITNRSALSASGYVVSYDVAFGFWTFKAEWSVGLPKTYAPSSYGSPEKVRVMFWAPIPAPPTTPQGDLTDGANK